MANSCKALYNDRVKVNKAVIAASVLGLVGVLAWAAHDPGPAAASARVWPGEASVVKAPHFAVPSNFGRRKIYLDAGHGAEGNTGNTSSRCQLEQDFTMALATELAAALRDSGHFEVALSRQPGDLVDYHARVRAAESFGAEAFVSLHSDVRGDNTASEGECPLSRTAPGFSVLWSDASGDDALNAERLVLARAVAERMQQIGVRPYDGGYNGLYDPDGRVAGVFVDRHEPAQRIFVLHKPAMRSVIIETHNAWDDREAKRWETRQVRDAFAQAVLAALIDALR